jgi:4-amino-4-deoxy-L-arabinose transferase-like glycosyltransferase
MKTCIDKLLDFFDSKRTILTVVLFGFLLRLSYLLLVSRILLVGDSFSYHTMTLQLMNHIPFAPFWPPGIPLYLMGLYYLFGVSEFIARVGMILWYLLFSGIAYSFIKYLLDRASANIAVLLFSIYPTFIYYSVEPVTQLPAATCLVAAAYLLCTIPKRLSILLPIALGITLGYASLIRPSFSPLIILASIFVFIGTRKVVFSAVPIFIALLVITPWIMKTKSLTGEYVAINYANSTNFFLGNNQYTPLYKTWWFGSHAAGEQDVPEAFSQLLDTIQSNPPAVRDKLYKQLAFDHIIARPDLFILRTVNRIRNYFAFDTGVGAFLIKQYHINKFVGLGLIAMDMVLYVFLMITALLYFTTGMGGFIDTYKSWVLLIFAIGYAFPYWFAFSHPTYHVPIMPLIGVFSVAYLVHCMRHSIALPAGEFTPRTRWKYLTPVVLFIFVAIQIEWVVVMVSRI